MAHTRDTENLGLPQFDATDKPTWLGDINSAMLTIDNSLGTLPTQVTSLSGTVGTMATQVATNSQEIGLINNEIGNVTLPTTAQTLTGAIAENYASIDAMSDVGTLYNLSNSTTVACNNRETTELATLTLPAGTYVIQYGATFASNSTGYRVVTLATASGTTNNYAVITDSAPDATKRMMNGIYIVSISQETTFYLNAYQNSGTTLNTSYKCIKALKIR